jgi:hypothetical protein
MTKYRLDFEMTVAGYRIVEVDHEEEAEEEAENFAAGVSCDEFYSSCEVESMPSVEVLWVTKEKPQRKKKQLADREVEDETR